MKMIQNCTTEWVWVEPISTEPDSFMIPVTKQHKFKEQLKVVLYTNAHGYHTWCLYSVLNL